MVNKLSFEEVKVNIPVRVRYTANYKTALTGFDREIDGDAIELIGDKLHVYCDIVLIVRIVIVHDRFQYFSVCSCKHVPKLKLRLLSI